MNAILSDDSLFSEAYDYLAHSEGTPRSLAFILTIVLCCYTLRPGQEKIRFAEVIVSGKEGSYELPYFCR